MRALVLDSDGTLALRDRPRPAAADECLIRVAAAGICGTDLELLRGYAGFTGIPGHEFVGVVEDAGANDSEWIGRRVVGEITVGCGECPGCRAAGRGHCDVRSVVGIRGRDGAFAEYVSLPSTNLHALPASLDDVTAVFVEPTAAACRVVEQVRIEPGMRAGVVGAGRLGMLVAQVLREHGAKVTVIVRSEASRSIAAALGFETADVDAVGTSLARRFEVAVDATGDPAGFAAAGALVRPRGTVVVKSTIHGETPVALSPLVVDEITVVGSRCGPFSRAIDLLSRGRIAVTPLVAGIYPLERFGDAFDRARRGLKVILTPILLLLLLLPSSASGQTQVHEWPGLCPAACCNYNKAWTATREAQAFAVPRVPGVGARDPAPVFTIREGDVVRALTGTLYTLETGTILVDEDFATDATYGDFSLQHKQIISFRAGETHDVYAHRSGTVYRIAHGNRVVDANLYRVGTPDACARDDAACAGVIIKVPVTTWWVLAVNAQNQSGWIENPVHFAVLSPCR